MSDRFEEWLTEQIRKAASETEQPDPEFEEALIAYLELLNFGIPVEKAKRIMNIYLNGKVAR